MTNAGPVYRIIAAVGSTIIRYGLRAAMALALVPAGGFAQGSRGIELFGGYSYFRLAGEPASGLTTASLNGWNAAVKLNLRPRVGLVADFGGNYGRQRMTATGFQPH